MAEKKRIEIVEVGPRDGLQNIKEFVPTEIKLEMIDRLAKAGLKNIQVTSYARETAVPQMKDSKEITRACLEKYPDIHVNALCLNKKSVEIALELGLKNISYVINASVKHNLLNAKRDHERAFEELAEVMALATANDMAFDFDIGSSFGFYDDEVSTDELMAFIKKGYDLGIRSFDICDSVGLADPSMIRERLPLAMKTFSDCRFSVHIHDTRNMGIVNTLAAIEVGVTRVQTSVGGLGGCPFAPGATGNTSTEDLIFMLHRMGYETGVDFEKLLETAQWAKGKIPTGDFSGHIMGIDYNKIFTQ